MLLLQQQQEITCRQARVRKLEQQLQYSQYELYAVEYEHRETERQLRLIQTQDIWVSADEHHTITHYRQLISNQFYRKRCQVQQLQDKITQEATSIRHKCHLWLLHASSSNKKAIDEKKNTTVTFPPKTMTNNSNRNSSTSTGSSSLQEAATVQYPSFVIYLGNQSMRWQDYLDHIVQLRSSNQKKFADMFLWSSTLPSKNHRIRRHSPPHHP
ncbi:hypothetical protein BDB00DRAFT_926399 [Zychaea mexicana]|uniref:uncharacterized protein n=1 Tax=Zychaea mexicana TaxID=64656 RepID=UPI0022FE70E0|nr:uncharacterized protein BDB00DRAFT_926399 [Zychaea mexicana]KAI9496826.1 hypothetical protein BDB00DRAFT_926399 [Zychaea mexicana]